MKNIYRATILMALTALMMNGCKKYEGEVHVPAYLHLDSIVVTNDPEHSISNQAGFFSSDIDAVQVELWFEGDAATTRLGTYTLPCTIPVLDNRTIQKVKVSPFVKQDGVAGTRTNYFYTDGQQKNLPLAADSVTNLGTYDEVNGRWYYEVHYAPSTMVLKQEYFEPQQYNIVFDSLMEWVKNDPAGACMGNGYGRMTIAPTSTDTTVTIEGTVHLERPEAALYLEMDYRSEVEVAIGMKSARTAGSNQETFGVENIVPTEKWTKMYVNLGKTWKWFNHNPDFQIVFTLLNEDKQGGSFCIDNVKIVAQ